MASHHGPAKGDGRNPATYGFVLEPAAIPIDEIVASGMPRDGLPALVDPLVMPAADVDAANSQGRGKLLLPDDLVAGVRIGREARAYPLRFLVWHEVVNDTLGGEPIAVAHSPLTATTVAFRRRVGDRTLTFGVSGLLHNSGHLLYDRGRGASLWSPLLLGPVTGPAVAAGDRLESVGVALCPWRRWRAENPATTLLAPDPALRREYRREPYASYFGSDLLRFPVRPLPPRPALGLKEPLLAVRLGGAFRAFPFRLVEERAGADGVWETEAEHVPLRFTATARPRAVTATSPDGGLQTFYTAYFAWVAGRGEGSMASGEEIGGSAAGAM